jgi:hypothetical protein
MSSPGLPSIAQGKEVSAIGGDGVPEHRRSER